MPRPQFCAWLTTFRLLPFLLGVAISAGAQQPKDLNTPREFPAISSRSEWEDRAKAIREQILVSCGLWPMPEKTPLEAKIFGKIERDGYSVEKVYFKPLPGFYLAGNLYRPLGRGKGPFPAILNPHGHWKDGRMADTRDGSIAGRCISFARQGMIAFSYDMVGYNDTYFPDHGKSPPDKFYIRHRRFATNHTAMLWSISQMGLQTWNTIRALDFLESLPDADRKRLACTGESGGGTQTFMLGAIDDRLAVQAPIVMVSHSMQGGCSCENVSGLRVEYSNMELAAAAVPRPQILVAATGDWTRATLTVEGPAIARIYGLFNAPEKFHFVRFDYGHNYNQTSREAVYGWFDQWLLKGRPAKAGVVSENTPIAEDPYQKEPDNDLRVWPDDNLPADALPESEFTNLLIRQYQKEWQEMVPRNRSSLAGFKESILPAWRRTLLVEWPQFQTESKWKAAEKTGVDLEISLPSESTKVAAVYFAPKTEGRSRKSERIIVLADPVGSLAARDDSGEPTGLAKHLHGKGEKVLAIKSFSTGEPKDQFANHYTTYNRTKLQERVRDLVAVCAQARTIGEGKAKSARPQIILCAVGPAGVWAMLAAPAADAVIADCNQYDLSSDANLLSPDLFCPGIRKLGGFESGAMLAAPNRLLLHNVGKGFSTQSIEATYKVSGARNLRIEAGRLSDEDLAGWIAAQE